MESLKILSKKLIAREISSEELVQSCFARVDAVEPRVKAFLALDRDAALTQARASDARRAKGQSRGPLDGIPVGIKDVISVKGQPLTCASKILKPYVSPYDATAIVRLQAAGAIPFGRLNMDEFAMGSSTENSAYQITHNPWDLTRIPGGSSGGSAAAVASGMVPAALGSDTGGSIRQPASLCNVVGLKPTYGAVSRYGLVAYASSLDQIGPFGRTVEDAAMLLQPMVGADPLDSTSYATAKTDYVKALTSEKGPFTLGVPKEYFGEGLDPEVAASVKSAIEFYRKAGHKIVEVSLPHTPLAIPVYYIIATAEASSNLARFDGVRYGHRSTAATDAIDLYFKSRGEGFGAEVKRRIILGTYVLSSGYYDAYYLKAQKVRTLIRNDFMEAFKTVDAIIGPTSPTAAFKIGERADNPIAMYLADIYTICVNLAGLPGLSMPCGFTKSGLPIGAQLIGQPYQEGRLLAIANAFDKENQLGLKEPKL